MSMVDICLKSGQSLRIRATSIAADFLRASTIELKILEMKLVAGLTAFFQEKLGLRVSGNLVAVVVIFCLQSVNVNHLGTLFFW